MYPDSRALDALKILLMLSILLSFPLYMFPTRECVDQLTFSGDISCFPSRTITDFRFYSQNIVITWIAYAIAVVIPETRTILNFTGAFSGTFIGFVFPSVFYLKTSELAFKADKKAWAACFMIIAGGLAGCVSLVLKVRLFDLPLVTFPCADQYVFRDFARNGQVNSCKLKSPKSQICVTSGNGIGRERR
jgi:hypothetical protein